MPDFNIKINKLTPITNILNPTEDKTGSWRIEQIQSYWPIVQDNFLFGMRWEGFELPVQFYHAEAGDIALFKDNTGHHFHSFYFDILFYFGITGIILFIFFMMVPVMTVVKNGLALNHIQLSFFIFSLSGIMYGLAYNLPITYWIISGVTILQVNMALQNKNNQSILTKPTAI